MTWLTDFPRQLEDERLLLRPYVLSDADVLLRTLIENRSRLENDFPSRVHEQLERSEVERFVEQKYLEWERGESFYFGVWKKNSDEYAGEISLKDFIRPIPSAEFGYFIAEKSEGRGLVTSSLRLLLPFAFDALGLKKMQIRCSGNNLRSQRVATRCGFILEGVLRNMFLCNDGTLHDLYYYGMTIEDYRKQRTREAFSD
jgi:ribosomal-protein-alanine N-acetyltransferase